MNPNTQQTATCLWDAFGNYTCSTKATAAPKPPVGFGTDRASGGVLVENFYSAHPANEDEEDKEGFCGCTANTRGM